MPGTPQRFRAIDKKVLGEMFRSIVFASCLVGLLTGFVVTGLQLVVTVPVIHEAETYEGGEHTHEQQTGTGEETAAGSGGVFAGLYRSLYAFQHAESEWEPKDGWQRSAYTLVANILTAIAFSLLLLAAFSLRPGIQWTEGLLWGIGGYATFFVLPALGLPPEIPGSFAADLVPRQGWWLLTVSCSGAGLALIILKRQWAWKIAGAILVLAPHLIGAPQPGIHGGTAPAHLAEAFIWRTAFVNAIFWLLLGGTGAWTSNKLIHRTNPSETTEPSAVSR